MRVKLTDERVLVVNGNFLETFDEDYTILEQEIKNISIPSCTPAQGLAALFILKGITDDDILEALNSIQDVNDRYVAQLAYKRATEWRIDSPAMQTIADILQLSENDLEELFRYASTVKV